MKKPSAIVAAVNSSMLGKSFIELGRTVSIRSSFCKRADRTGLMFSVELNAGQRRGIFERERGPTVDAEVLLYTLTLTAPDAGVGLMNKDRYDASARGLKSKIGSRFKYSGRIGQFGEQLGSCTRKTEGNSREAGA